MHNLKRKSLQPKSPFITSSVLLCIFLFLCTSFLAAQSNTFRGQTLEQHVTSYAYEHADALVYWNLRKPDDDDGRVSRFRLGQRNFLVSKVESVGPDMKKVYYNYDLVISDSECNKIAFGKQYASINIYCSLTKGERFSDTNFWTGVTTYGKDGDKLYIKAIDPSATPLYNDLFPHPDINEGWLREGCRKPKPKYNNVNLEVSDEYSNIYVYDTTKSKVNLLEYIVNKSDSDIQFILSFDLKCMSCILLLSSAGSTLNEYGLTNSLFLLSRDTEFDDLKTILPEEGADHYLWSSIEDTSPTSFSAISKSSKMPDFFILKKGVVKYYRQGKGNFKIDELESSINQAVEALSSDSEELPFIDGLIRN